MARFEWMGREVVFHDFDILKGREVRAAFAEDGERGSYACLVASARYADSGEPVFLSIADVEAQPFRLQQRVLRLAGEAAKINGMLGVDDDDDGERITNGSGEPAGPSL